MTWAVKMADARYDGYDEGYEKGISIELERGLATGREEGAYQNKLETARSLLSEGLDPQMVAHCTNLPLERCSSWSEKSAPSPSTQKGSPAFPPGSLTPKP